MSRMAPAGPVLQCTLEALGAETGMELNLSLLWVQAAGRVLELMGLPGQVVLARWVFSALPRAASVCTLTLSSSSEFSSPALWV